MGETGVLNKNVMERLEWVADPFGISDKSGLERKDLARHAWDKIAERPFLEAGPELLMRLVIFPHNQYLSFMLDHGLIGMTIFPAQC